MPKRQEGRYLESLEAGTYESLAMIHKYLFDEIISNMPLRGKKTREEQDAFYSQFFDCAGKFLKNGGHMILYSNEGGFVKKQLRRHMEYRLLDEFCIREKEGFYLFIVGKKG